MKIIINELQTVTETYEIEILKTDIPDNLTGDELQGFLHDYAYENPQDWVFKERKCLENQMGDIRLEEGKIEKPKVIHFSLSHEDIQNLTSRLFMLAVIGELSFNHMQNFESFLTDYISFKEQLIAEGYSFEWQEKKGQ